MLEVSTQRNPVYETTEFRVLYYVVDECLDDVSKKD
jgi:hypothetical protein